MKRILPLVIAIGLAGPALAQTPPSNPNPDTPAVTGSDAPQPAQPAKGANSFTEDQAKSRIEAKGFSNVTGLAKDDDGIWRVMHSEDDQVVPFADSAPLAVKLLKRGELKFYAGLPHGMFASQPEVINPDILAFIAK